MHSFSRFNREYLSKYGWLEKEFYFVSMLLDQILRNELAGRHDRANSKIDFMLKKAAFSILAFPLSLRSIVIKETRKSLWVGKLARFSYLKSRICHVGRAKGYKVVSSHNDETCKSDGYKHYQVLALNSFSIFVLYLMLKVLGTEKVLQRKTFLSVVNFFIRKKCESVSKRIKRNNTKVMFELDDQMPDKRILAYSASLVGVHYYVIAHGYFVDPLGVSVLPVNAKKLFVWTEHQRKLIEEQDKCSEVEVLGIPYVDEAGIDFEAISRADLSDAILVVLPFIWTIEKLDSIIRQVLSLSKWLPAIDVKLHPLNSSFESHLQGYEVNVLKSKTELDHNELLKYRYIAGGTSSSLILAAALGLKVFYISDWSSERAEELNPCSFDNLVRNFELYLREDSSVDISLTKSFDVFLRDLI